MSKKTGRGLELGRQRNKRYRDNMSPEQKKRKYERDKKLREQKKRNRLTANPELLEQGKRICSRCFKKKQLSEYSTKGRNPANYNDMCDTCLIKLYQSKSYSPDVLTPEFWRKKAYSCNGGYVSRQKRRGRSVEIQELNNKVSGEELIRLFEEQKHRCLYCEKDLSDGRFQLDHSTPVSREGQHHIDNISILCFECNMLKFDKTAKEFAGFIKEYAQNLLRVIESQDKEPGR